MKRAAISLLLAILGFAVPNWKEIDRLVSEQKLEEASKAVAAIRAEARGRGDAGEETKALVREVQLREALHGYETAVRFLSEEPWPKTPMAAAVLNLFYADALVTYARAYSWEIGQREKVETRGAVDLKAWTREQIWAEAARAFARRLEGARGAREGRASTRSRSSSRSTTTRATSAARCATRLVPLRRLSRRHGRVAPRAVERPLHARPGRR